MQRSRYCFKTKGSNIIIDYTDTRRHLTGLNKSKERTVESID
jgi:hypothetical protein